MADDTSAGAPAGASPRLRPYDPLTAPHPGEGLAHVPSYWAATAGPPPDDDGPLTGACETDVAIIGAGYTGLSCAAHLARDYGAAPLVLEANRPLWGCSGRNGSFAGPVLGRVPLVRWVARWGETGARTLWDESLAALGTLRGLIRDGAIDCDVQPDGRLRVAHSPARVRDLQREARVLRSFGYECELLDAADIAARHFRGNEAHAALATPDGFVLHPMKLGYGVLRMARQAGARVHSSSPVTGWAKAGGWHRLTTPRGEVRARTVVFATNGYGNERLHPCLAGGLLPVLSNIVVTRPMSDAEQAESGFVSTHAVSDTRKFLNYYRLLPDRRILLGSRGPLTEAGGTSHRARLLGILKRKLPALGAIEADYFWGGWVAITRDAMPHVGYAGDDASVCYALGYCGSGVAAAHHAGRRLAEALGARRALPPHLGVPLPRFPLARLRRLAQALAFGWFALRDGLD